MRKASKQFKSYAEQLKEAYKDVLARKIREDLCKIKGLSTAEEIVDFFNSFLEREPKSGSTVKIPDPLYSRPIHLLSPANELLSLPIFNRLRSIRQLSFSCLSYPSANHTRFEHALGTYYLSQQLLGMSRVKSMVDDETKKAFMIAAILHDIGEGPGSHSLEKLFGHKYDQIKTLDIIDDKKYGVRTLLGNELRETVKKILPGGPPLTKKEEKKYRFFKESLDSEIDIDRLDYLGRDGYFCGIQAGRIDPLYIIECADYIEEDYGYAFTSDPHTIELLNGAISARTMLYPLIYQDERRMAADEAFCHAFFACCRSWAPEKWMILANKMIYLNDHQILSLMQSLGDRYAREFVSGVLNCDVPYIQSCKISIKDEKSLEHQFWDLIWGRPFELIVLLECAFCELLGIPKSDFEPKFFIRFPLQNPREKKKRSIRIRTKEGKSRDIREFSTTSAALLDVILPSYNCIFFFTEEEYSQKASHKLNKIFSEENLGNKFIAEVEQILSPIGKLPTPETAKFSEEFSKSLD